MVEKMKDIFLKEPLPFTDKRDVNWALVKKTSLFGVIGLVLVLLVLPEPEAQTADFTEEKTQTVAERESEVEKINNETLDVLSKGQRRNNSDNLDYLSRRQEPTTSKHEHSSTMVIPRSDLNSGNTLPISIKIPLVLKTDVKIEGSQIPIMAIVSKDVSYKDNLAIPKGAALFGQASFSESERANIQWTLVQFPNGMEKQIQAQAIGFDGRPGVTGDVEGTGLKNTAGYTLSRLIGAYAEGSKETGPLGANRGGHKNGVRNAIAETAKDRSESWAQDLQKESKWIVLPEGIEFYALITQPFVFRDPGATYGQ